MTRWRCASRRWRCTSDGAASCTGIDGSHVGHLFAGGVQAGHRAVPARRHRASRAVLPNDPVANVVELAIEIVDAAGTTIHRNAMPKIAAVMSLGRSSMSMSVADRSVVRCRCAGRPRPCRRRRSSWALDPVAQRRGGLDRLEGGHEHRPQEARDPRRRSPGSGRSAPSDLLQCRWRRDRGRG